MLQQGSSALSYVGAALAATGLAHFASPRVFDKITAPAFPTNTRTFTLVNGTLETAIGIGLAVPATRRAALGGLLGYVAYVGVNAARHR